MQHRYIAVNQWQATYIHSSRFQINFFTKELAVYEKMPDQVKITHEGNFARHVMNTEKVTQLQEWHKNVVNSWRVQKDTI